MFNLCRRYENLVCGALYDCDSVLFMSLWLVFGVLYHYDLNCLDNYDNGQMIRILKSKYSIFFFFIVVSMSSYPLGRVESSRIIYDALWWCFGWISMKKSTAY